MRARHLALQLHGEGEPLAYERVHLVQPRVRREQHERTPARDVEDLFDQRSHAPREARIFRVAIRRRHEEPRLRAVIEGRRRDVLLRVVDAERAAQKRERRSGRDRRAREHDALRSAKERRAQILGHIEGRRVHRVAALAVGPLHPRDRLVVRQRRAIDGRDVREHAAHREVAPPLRFRDVFRRTFERGLPVREEPVLEPIERALHGAECLDRGLVRGERIAVAGDARERLHEPAHRLVDLRIVTRRQVVRAVHAAHQPVHARRGERGRQRRGGPRFALVRFVENGEVVGR